MDVNFYDMHIQGTIPAANANKKNKSTLGDFDNAHF